MRRIFAAVVLTLVLAFVFGAAQAPEEKKKDTVDEKKVTHEYVGVKKCAMCHKSKARGNQYGQWESSAHAKAYKTLAGDAAKEIAKGMGIEDPQKSPKCLRCHVTAYGVDEKLLGSKYQMDDGVGCESCHGPGGDYMKLSIMKDVEKAIEAGLMIPTEELCVSCHNEESPTYKKFVYKEYYSKIAHPIPTDEQDDD